EGLELPPGPLGQPRPPRLPRGRGGGPAGPGDQRLGHQVETLALVADMPGERLGADAPRSVASRRRVRASSPASAIRSTARFTTCSWVRATPSSESACRSNGVRVASRTLLE